VIHQGAFDSNPATSGPANQQRQLPAGKPRSAPPHPSSIKLSAAHRLSLSFLSFAMSTTSFKPVAAEPVDEQNGLIHGVSAQELQIIGAQAIDAKAKAYCMYDPTKWKRTMLTAPHRPVLSLPRWRITSSSPIHNLRARDHRGRKRRKRRVSSGNMR
jgi:hypothetical protein